MIYLFNTLISCILALVIFLAVRAISVGLDARSKIKRTQPKLKKKRKK